MSSHYPSRSRITFLLFLLLLFVGYFFLMRHAQQVNRDAITIASQQPAVPRRAAAPKSRMPSDPSQPKPIRISSKGKVRVKPGETAVLSYWELEPGVNGIVLVTPETMPDGNVRLSSRILKVPDKAVGKSSAEDMFPGVFATEHHGAVGPRRLGEFLEAVEGSDDVNSVSQPSVVTKSGSSATIQSVVYTLDGPRIGDTLSLHVNSVADGGYDVDMTFHKEGVPTN